MSTTVQLETTTSSRAEASGSQPRTPPHTTHTNPPIQKDTPARARSVDHSGYRTGTLDERRSAVIDDLGQVVPEVDLEFFLDNILPPLRDGFELTKIVESLERNGHISNGCWKSFEVKPESMKQTREPLVFSPLAGLFDAIVQAADERSHGHNQTLTLIMDPNRTPFSENGNTQRPDGYMVLKEAECVELSWYNFGLTMEVKKRESSELRDDNVGKQVFNMQQHMRLDPCRRSTFGITIENCNMRLWFCSRAVVLVSGGFNFRTDLETLVRVFLSFAFASKTELGWDPTVSVTTTTESGPRIYHFKVGNEIFETVGVLSDLGAEAMVGRATRVFKVKKRDGTLAVLKDVWVDDDRELEHVLRVKILNDVEAKYNKDVRRRVSKYLLTPITAGLMEVDGQIDHTTNVLMRGAIPLFDNIFDLVFVKPVFNDKRNGTGYSQTSDQISYQVVRGPRENARKYIHHRVHYRIVFREVASPLYSVRELSSVFTVLRDISKVLEYIHTCGWVHRDISAGNIYWYDSKRGLLGDLEYAKKTGVDAEHEVRTGTLDFMAIEIASREHLFLPGDEDGARIFQNWKKLGLDVVEEQEEEFSEAEEGFTGSIEKTPATINGLNAGEEPSDGNEGLDEIGEEQENTREIPELEDAGEEYCDVTESHNSQNGGLDKAEERPETENKEVSSNEVDSVETSAKSLQVSKGDDEECPMPKLPLLSYNCLHDMESVWWAAIWMLFFHEDSSEKNERAEADRTQQVETANELFPRHLVVDKRAHFFMSRYTFSDRTQCLPQSFRDIIKHPFSLRGALRTRYIRAEATLPTIDEDAFEGVHKEFTRAFELAILGSQNVNIDQLVRPPEAPTQSNKRKAKHVLSSSIDARKRSRSLKSNGN